MSFLEFAGLMNVIGMGLTLLVVVVLVVWNT